MHIYQPFILTLCDRLAYTEYDPQHDFEIAALIAAQAHTILFRADQALALRPALERFAESVEYRLPFGAVILQFDRPIPEQAFFEVENPEQSDSATLAVIAQMWADAGLPLHDWTPQDGDGVAALLLTQDEDDAGVVHNQAVAFFASTAINRVHWKGSDLTWLPNIDRSFAENKRTLRNLAVACVAYLNCINLMLEKHEPPEKVQRRRTRDGKPPLLSYYTVEVAPGYRSAGGEGAGAKHGYRYDVAGHFRRLIDGRLIWVRPHQRGLAHDLYIPSVRKVE